MKKEVKRDFRQLNDREHILARPAVYIGNVDKCIFSDYFLENNRIVYEEIEYVPAFIKIINEVLDNSIDEAIRTKFEHSNKIKISFNDKENNILIEDNGRGIPVEQNKDNIYIPILCWGHSKSGENFSNDSDRETIGMNGVGSYASNVYSLSFIGETCDGKNKFIGTWMNNAETLEYNIKKGSNNGTKVQFQPDLKKLSLKKTEVFSKDSLYKKIIKQRLFNLSICFPKIKFYFDGDLIKSGNNKTIFSQFGECFESISNDNCMLAIYPNVDESFRSFSYINGLYISNAGSHIDLISNEITGYIREKLSKKYKSIKPGEIKNKLFIVFYGLNFPSPKFDSQTKEKLTNSVKELREYMDGIDLEKLANRILKNEKIIDPIVEIYKIKEEFKKRQEINSLKKSSKTVKDDKYLPPTSNNLHMLLLGEGESAVSGISSALGRDGIGYYELKGIPMNTYEEKILNVLSNKEMKTLVDILDLDLNNDKKEDSQDWYIVIINDKEYIVNKNDDILIDGYYYSIDDLIKKINL